MLVLTDGEIMDLQDTINEIVEASELPLSIVITGIGDADFTSMEVIFITPPPFFIIYKYIFGDLNKFNFFW